MIAITTRSSIKVKPRRGARASKPDMECSWKKVRVEKCHAVTRPTTASANAEEVYHWLRQCEWDHVFTAPPEQVPHCGGRRPGGTRPSFDRGSRAPPCVKTRLVESEPLHGKSARTGADTDRTGSIARGDARKRRRTKITTASSRRSDPLYAPAIRGGGSGGINSHPSRRVEEGRSQQLSYVIGRQFHATTGSIGGNPRPSVFSPRHEASSQPITTSPRRALSVATAPGAPGWGALAT
jgi:hypothetical protein